MASLAVADIVFTALFAIEVVIKVISMGLITPFRSVDRDDGAYLRDGWNVLDFVVVLASVLTLLAGELEGQPRDPMAGRGVARHGDRTLEWHAEHNVARCERSVCNQTVAAVPRRADAHSALDTGGVGPAMQIDVGRRRSHRCD